MTTRTSQVIDAVGGDYLKRAMAGTEDLFELIRLGVEDFNLQTKTMLEEFYRLLTNNGHQSAIDWYCEGSMSSSTGSYGTSVTWPSTSTIYTRTAYRIVNQTLTLLVLDPKEYPDLFPSNFTIAGFNKDALWHDEASLNIAKSIETQLTIWGDNLHTTVEQVYEILITDSYLVKNLFGDKYWEMIMIEKLMLGNTASHVQDEVYRSAFNMDKEQFKKIVGVYKYCNQGRRGAFVEKMFSLPNDRRKIPHSYDDSSISKPSDDKYSLRIGDFVCSIPPELIHVSTVNSTSSVSGIRQKNSTQVHNGYKNRILRITLFFNGIRDINGYSLTGPMRDIYYINGLISLLAQFKKTPFLPIHNRYINETIKIENVALSNINISTVEGFPTCIQAELTLLEFNSSIFTNMPDGMLSGMIDWDLFRWYYQQSIGNKKGQLKPMPKKGVKEDIKLQILREDVIKGLSNVQEFNDVFDITDESNYIEYDLSVFSSSVTSITGAYQNLLPKIQTNGAERPAYQYMGSTDVRLNIIIETLDMDLIEIIEDINTYLNNLVRMNNKYAGIGFCKIQNDMTNMLGVDHCTIESITTSTVPDFPSLYRISIDIISFDIHQKAKESLTKFMPFTDVLELDAQGVKDKELIEFLMSQTISMGAHGLYTKIQQDLFAEKKMSYSELYPDLDLPTYKEIDRALMSINSYRVSNGLSEMPFTSYPRESNVEEDHYVDPDFYIMYPFDYVVENEDWDDPAEVYKKLFDKELKFRKESGATILGVSVDGKAIENPTQYRFTRNNMNDKEIGEPAIAPSPLTGFVDRSNPISDNTYNGERAMVDMITYNKRGRLVRAFPTYLFVIIDESSQFLDGRKMWNNYYVTHNLLELSIHNTRETGIATVTASLNNIYGNLSKSRAEIDWLNKSSSWFKRELGLWFGTTKVTEEMLKSKVRLFDSIKIRSGCRIHIRQGYGSNVEELPIVFNGIITEIQQGQVVNIIAQSDAIELHNSVVESNKEKTTNGALKLGGEPSNIIKNLLNDRKNISAHIIHEWFESNKYGIEHFGLFMYGRRGSYNNNRITVMKNEYKLAEYILKDPRANKPNPFGEAVEFWYGNAYHEQYNWGYNDYDLIKNVYRCNKDYRILPYYESYSLFGIDNENNIETFIYNNTPWELMQKLANVVPEYITAPMFHQFDTRIFYGVKGWLAKYRYDIWNDIVFERAKTFSQYHCIDSNSDIIANNMKATSKGIATNITPVYTVGDGQRSGSTLYADKKIDNEKQKNKIIYTDAHQGVFGYYFDNLKMFNNENAKEQGYGIGVSTLMEEFSNAYKGDIIIIGDSSIKPHDCIGIHDEYSSISGMVGVRAVTHTISAQEGFITTITPEMIVFNNLDGASFLYSFLTRLSSVGMGYVGRMALLSASRASIERLSGRAKKFYKKSKYVQEAIDSIKEVKFLDKTKDFFKTTSSIVKTGDKIKDIGKGLWNLAKEAKGAKKVVAGASIASNGILPVVGPIITWIAGEIAIELVMNAVIDFFRYNNCIKILPVYYEGYPYISGFNGQESLILGNSTEFDIELDERQKLIENALKVTAITGLEIYSEIKAYKTQIYQYRTSPYSTHVPNPSAMGAKTAPMKEPDIINWRYNDINFEETE